MTQVTASTCQIKKNTVRYARRLSARAYQYRVADTRPRGSVECVI
jgi:hypothetical protein